EIPRHQTSPKAFVVAPRSHGLCPADLLGLIRTNQLEARIAPPGEAVIITGVIENAAVHNDSFPMGIGLGDDALDRLMRRVRLVVTEKDAGDKHPGTLACRLGGLRAWEELLCLDVCLGSADIQKASGTAEAINAKALDPCREEVPFQRKRASRRDLFDQR